MRKKQNFGQRFWVLYENGHAQVSKDIGTFHLLSHFLLKETLRANDLRFIRKDKIEFINLWTDYLNAIEYGKQQLTPREAIPYIARIIVDSYEVRHNSLKRKISNRNKRWLVLKMIRQLEAEILPTEEEILSEIRDKHNKMVDKQIEDYLNAPATGNKLTGFFNE